MSPRCKPANTNRTCCRSHSSLLLNFIVLLGMTVLVSGRPRPVEWSDRSSEDILAGVDFLSVFMNSAEERSYDTPITTHAPLTQPPTTDNNNHLNEDEPNPTTNPSTEVEDQDRTTILPDSEVTTEVTVIETIPSAIQSASKRNEFKVDEPEPITQSLERLKPEGKVKRKSEDLLAIGANPDYIAQQQSRVNRDGLTPYNHPYHSRIPSSSRGRSVSYNTAVQSLPHQNKSWKQDDERIINSPLDQSKDYSNEYDYTESYPNFNKKNSSTGNHHIDSTAESKDYFVTRKYNSGDFNDSGDKSINRQPPKSTPEVKKSFEHTERNWGIPEKNYELPETEHHRTPTVYGRPEQNYEVDESVSVMTNGRTHGVQNASQGKANDKPLQLKVGQAPVKPDDNQKIGYVVEGRNYRKYRVEERTADGFIVGEYGVVSNNDGSLRGVRYTADGTINPRVIYDALMKFLAL